MPTSRPQLVLDIGGVLLADLTPTFWRWVAEQAAVPYDEVLARFRQDVRTALWTGVMREDQFWHWFCSAFSQIDENTARSQIAATLLPLSAAAHLAVWAKIVDIHLLSNHCAAWVLPALAGMLESVTTVTISSAVGSCKPDLAVYTMVASRLPPDASVLFVDDQQKNFPPAVALGWQTLHADHHGHWVHRIPFTAQYD